MLRFEGSQQLHRIVVLNPKGGSGKSTLALNVAGYLASKGRQVAIVDMDEQGSTTQWLQTRGDRSPYIHSIHAAYEPSQSRISDQVVAVPEQYDFVVVDAPAGVAAKDLTDFTCGAHAILIPVVPSAFDIHAASRLISDLLLVARVSRSKGRLGIVANRIRQHTLSYRRLQTFLERLSITAVGTLRDSQNYVRAAHEGLCIHELPPSSVRSDLAQWAAITDWLEQRLAAPLTPRDWFRPNVETAPTTPTAAAQTQRTAVLRAAAAVAVLAAGISLGIWQMTKTETPEIRPEPVALQATPEPGPRAIERVEATPAPAPSDEFRDKWQLSGVAQTDGDSVVLLSQRDDRTMRRIRTGAELDGWLVKDTGPNYAVFSQDGAEVRLVLNEPRAE